MKSLLILCTLFAGCTPRSVQDTNTLLDGILSEAEKNMRSVIDLPNMEISESYNLLVFGVSVTAYGVYVSRQAPYVKRSGDGTSGGYDDAEILETYVSSAPMYVRLDNVTTETGLFTVKSSVVMKFQGKYHFEITVGKSDEGLNCTSTVTFFDLPTPELVDFTSDGLFGAIFDLVVGLVKRTFVLEKVIYKFFGPVFSATTTEEVKQAVSLALCKPS